MKWLETLLEKFACRQQSGNGQQVSDDGQIRIVVIGDGASGKTALLTRKVVNVTFLVKKVENHNHHIGKVNQ